LDFVNNARVYFKTQSNAGLERVLGLSNGYLSKFEKGGIKNPNKLLYALITKGYYLKPVGWKYGEEKSKGGKPSPCGTLRCSAPPSPGDTPEPLRDFPEKTKKYFYFFRKIFLEAGLH